jgi:hypothetical protein
VKYQPAGKINPESPLKRRVDRNIEPRMGHEALVLEGMVMIMITKMTCSIFYIKATSLGILALFPASHGERQRYP